MLCCATADVLDRRFPNLFLVLLRPVALARDKGEIDLELLVYRRHAASTKTPSINAWNSVSMTHLYWEP